MKKDGREGKTAVVVGTVTDDLRLFTVPKLTVGVASKVLLIKIFISI